MGSLLGILASCNGTNGMPVNVAGLWRLWSNTDGHLERIYRVVEASLPCLHNNLKDRSRLQSGSKFFSKVNSTSR